MEFILSVWWECEDMRISCRFRVIFIPRSLFPRNWMSSHETKMTSTEIVIEKCELNKYTNDFVIRPCWNYFEIVCVASANPVGWKQVLDALARIHSVCWFIWTICKVRSCIKGTAVECSHFISTGKHKRKNPNFIGIKQKLQSSTAYDQQAYDFINQFNIRAFWARELWSI